MATVYSLVCWGGLTGKSVVASNSGGLIFTTTSNHGLRDATPLQFVATTLPGGVLAATTYYAKSLSLTTFSIYAEADLINRVAWSSAGSAVVAKSKKMLDLLQDYSGRWYDSGTGFDRVYDGPTSWNTQRTNAPASPLDVEVCEIGENFICHLSAVLNITVPAAAIRIETKIAGVRTEAFHYGVVTAGFCLHAPVGSIDMVYVNRPYVTLDGFSLTCIPGWYNTYHIRLNNYAPTVINMVVVGGGGQNSPTTYGTGIRCEDVADIACIMNNVVVGCDRGFALIGYAQGVLFGNNTASNNTVGMWSDSNMSGRYYNNISAGNTTNYFNTASTGAATGNAGPGSQAWMFGTGTFRVTADTTDFLGYGATPIDLRPANGASPQVDAGVEYYGAMSLDVSGNQRPNYNNGGSEAYDIGAYEFDHGYGLRPASHVLTLNNVVVGSRVHVSDQAGTVTHYDDLAASSTVVITQTVYGDSRDSWRIRVRNASSTPSYQPYETLMTASAGSSSLYIAQIPDE